MNTILDFVQAARANDLTNLQIAGKLNTAGHRSRYGKPLTAQSVSLIFQGHVSFFDNMTCQAKFLKKWELKPRKLKTGEMLESVPHPTAQQEIPLNDEDIDQVYDPNITGPNNPSHTKRVSFERMKLIEGIGDDLIQYIYRTFLPPQFSPIGWMNVATIALTAISMTLVFFTVILYLLNYHGMLPK